ncbi:unnamed protein product [Choristocarpus tenellus]
MVRNIGELWLLTALAFSLHSSRLSAIVCPDTTSQSLRVSDTDGATDLSAAVNCTGGTVNVVWVGLVTILGTIEVGQDTTLNIVGEVGDGGTGAVINGASSVRIFEVGTGATLQVENTTIRGGLADAAGGGGVRCSGASLILVDCVFESNESNGSGGGVWMEESTIIVTGGSFVRNTAAEGMGGAVHALDSNLTIDSVFFDGNRALNGGAIHVTGAELESWGRTICNLARSTLGNNVATAPLPLSHPDLVPSSYSMPGGGGVYIENATLDVIDCMLHNNSATSWGGALNSNRANVTVSGTNLRGNKAMHSGGAALVGDAIIDGGTTVIGNFAENYGGGIFQRDNCVMILGDVLFANNDGNLGGALFGDGVVKVLGGTVMNGTNIAHDKGGCIYARGSSIFSIYGGTFTGCNSEGNGGFLYASAGSVVEMFDGTVDSCLAKERAGVVS